MFGERLKRLRLKKGVTQKELAAIIGVDRTSIGKYELNNVTPGSDALRNIADYFAVSIDYLLGRDIVDVEKLELGGVKSIPVAGSVKYAAAGPVFSEYDGEVMSYARLSCDVFDCRVLEPMPVESSHERFVEDVFAMKCKGESMAGIGVFDGDIAIVSKQDDVDYGELAVVAVDYEEGMLRRVKKKDSVLILESANIDYSPRIFIGQDCGRVKIIGKLLQVIKQF